MRRAAPLLAAFLRAAFLRAAFLRAAFLLGALLLGTPSCGGGASAPPERPHVVLITADTLRADHVGCYGYRRDTTPHLDALAATATRFADAVTVIPKTCPSFTTVFTGLHPLEHGVRHNRVRVPDDVPLAAELLRSRGYRTAAFVGNAVLRPDVGLDRGFDVYRFFPEGEAAVERANADFLEWAAAEPWDRPTFVWLHYLDPHGPYTPPPDVEALFEGDALDTGTLRVPTRYTPVAGFHPNKILGAVPLYQNVDGEDRASVYVRRYDAEIRTMDAALGRALDALRGAEVFDDAAILFLSDHGESLGEHDYWFEHGWFAYDATLRVPLVLKAPGQTDTRVVEEQVSLLDVFPTLLDLAGHPPRETHGASLLAEPAPRRSVVVANSAKYPISVVGVRGENEKLLRTQPQGTFELYDLATDPHETRDLESARPDATRDARHRLQALLDTFRAPSDLTNREQPVEGALAEQMRALGYGDD